MTYEETRAAAQVMADKLGMDVGVENLPPVTGWRCFLLPCKQNRSGHELQCEVVHPSSLENTKPGYGYGGGAD